MSIKELLKKVAAVATIPVVIGMGGSALAEETSDPLACVDDIFSEIADQATKGISPDRIHTGTTDTYIENSHSVYSHTLSMDGLAVLGARQSLDIGLTRILESDSLQLFISTAETLGVPRANNPKTYDIETSTRSNSWDILPNNNNRLLDFSGGYGSPTPWMTEVMASMVESWNACASVSLKTEKQQEVFAPIPAPALIR